MTLAMMTVTGGGDDARESPVIDQEMHVAVMTMTRGGWTIAMTRERGNDDNVDDEGTCVATAMAVQGGDTTTMVTRWCVCQFHSNSMAWPQ